MSLLAEIADGRTDLVFEYLGQGHPATSTCPDGVSLIRHCAYYGDVSAMKFLIANGESLAALGPNFELASGAFFGHWRLCRFLLDHGADPNLPDPETGETPLHAALCKAQSPQHDLVLRVLLDFGANPNAAAKAGAETGGFMRDCRTKGEFPLHRAAAFASEEAIDLLLAAGAKVDARDANGDTPLSWASWYLRSGTVLRKLCYGGIRVGDAYCKPNGGMEGFLRGTPHPRIYKAGE
ncbi:MAG: ankyrin repeat domain-containing protein [Bryobacteraceae bacterium]